MKHSWQSTFKFNGKRDKCNTGLGVFELLPNHENYISTLKEGVISICKKENFAPYFIVSKAFMKFENSSNTCEVIGDYAINISEVKNLKKDYINEIILNSHYEDEKSFYKFISQYLLQ